MFFDRAKAVLRLSAVRHTLWLLTLFSLITLIAWGGTYWLVQREMLRMVDERLIIRMEAAEMALERGDALPAPTVGQTAEMTDGTFTEGFKTIDSEGRRSIEFRYFVRTTEQGQVRLGENTERQEELRDILAGGMQLTFVGTLLVTALAGLWLARRSQARLGAINNGLAKIAQGHLDTRIALSGPDDDLSLLAKRINATAERLEDAMTQMRVQSSNIAHDLRTPLARLRARLETSLVALAEDQRAVSEDELGEALEQIDQITATFDALLRLARIESGAGREAFSAVDLTDMVSRLEETFGPVIEASGKVFQVDTTDPARVSGDADMLFQLFANLIQNALRHGISGETITLRAQGAHVSVSDEGPGIPFAEREKVLQPLYQQETTRQGEGFGLGLSLVRAIADLHAATLSLSDGPNGRGLTVSLRFPELTKL
ncbi:HAMP domain-containing sensor histidine kinase [Ahrensia marina]|uniref:sensor histidine kinase n=1 Tax=Ahrensia marina TaxID=1514904 RepID=UPI0035D0D5D8